MSVLSDMQAAVGLSQLRKLDRFIEARRRNFDGLRQRLPANGMEEFFHLPEAAPEPTLSWEEGVRDLVRLSCQ